MWGVPRDARRRSTRGGTAHPGGLPDVTRPDPKPWTLAGRIADERQIVADLRKAHPTDYLNGRDWGTWENVMRTRNGDEPVRPPVNRP